jgi:hypothetical protein
MKPFIYAGIIAASIATPMMALANPILSVKIPGDAAAVELTAEELLSLKQIEISTANDYVDGMAVFSGPLLRSVFGDYVLKPTDKIKLTALNDYSTEMPAAEAIDYDVILAMTMNGNALSVREKGPLWVIYPMSDHKELQVPEFNDRLVWQLSKVEIIPSP